MKRIFVAAILISLMELVPAQANETYVGTPSPITELRIVNVEGDRYPIFDVRLQWDQPLDNGSRILSYEIYAREMPRALIDGDRTSNFPWRIVHSSKSASRDVTFELPYWARNKAIEFTVVAHNEYGPSHEPEAKFINVAMAKVSSCALSETGNIYCWGTSEGFGALGESATGFKFPRKIMGVPKASDIAGGDVHYCAISSGDVYCWGQNLEGEVNGQPGGSFTAGQKVSLPAKAVEIQVGDAHSCAVLATGDLWCWGYDGYSQLAGAGPEPSMIYGGPFQKVRSEGAMTCVLDLEGSVFCTGITNGDYYDFSLPISFSGPASDIAVGQHATCAVVSSGVECFGFGENGELGTNYVSSSTPRLVPDSQGLTEIFTKRYSICGLGVSKEVKCWGNSWVETKTWTSTTPRQYQSIHRPALLRAVELHNRSQPKLFSQDMAPTSAPFTNDGTYDELSNSMPAVSRLQDPVVVAPGEHGSCGIDRIGQLWCSAPVEFPPLDIVSNEDALYDDSGDYIGRQFIEAEPVYFLYQHFLTQPRFRYESWFYGSSGDFPERKELSTSLSGKNEVGSTLTAALGGFDSRNSAVEYVWYRGTGEFSEGNFAQFEAIGLSHSRSYKVTEADRNKTIGVVALVASDRFSYQTKAEAFLLSGQGQEQANPFGWTKRLSSSQAKLYAKDIVGAGKVRFVLNGKEIAWVNAQDATDRKLRLAGGSNYLVRTVNLSSGKNVLEIYIAGERLRRVIYSR